MRRISALWTKERRKWLHLPAHRSRITGMGTFLILSRPPSMKLKKSYRPHLSARQSLSPPAFHRQCTSKVGLARSATGESGSRNCNQFTRICGTEPASLMQSRLQPTKSGGNHVPSWERLRSGARNPTHSCSHGRRPP